MDEIHTAADAQSLFNNSNVIEIDHHSKKGSLDFDLNRII